MRLMASASLLLLLLASSALSEPILRRKNQNQQQKEEEQTNQRTTDPLIPPDQNQQPTDLDICVLQDGITPGTTTLLEDCETLDQFQDQPPDVVNLLGPSILICCPYPTPDYIYFPTDELPSGAPGDYDFGDPDFGDDGAPLNPDDDSFLADYSPTFDGTFERPKPEEKCRGDRLEGTACKEFHQCAEADFTQSEPPLTCGYDNAKRVHKFCCRDEFGASTKRPKLQKIKRLGGRRRSYPCEDYLPSECSRWARQHPDSCVDDEHGSFVFMSIACMKSCGHCQNEGCVDEFEKCEDWSRTDCVNHPDVMSIYCRASCGTCGFYSPRNFEQQVVNGNSYTNTQDRRFYCGAGESIEDVNAGVRSGDDTLVFGRRRRKRQVAQDELERVKEIIRKKKEQPLDLHTYATDIEGKRGFKCGSVVISDRFAILAAHCLISFGESKIDADAPVILIRDRTNFQAQMEVKRFFSHPGYKFPSLYDDIAVAELGRRIDYDYAKYGDTPACIGDRESDLAGIKATAEGYGLTEKDVTSDILLTVNVTVMDNRDCATYLKHNTSEFRDLRSKLKKALEFGINEQLLCTVGEYNATLDVYSGPCEGDSGGPLYVNHGTSLSGADRRHTVEGIVSGGLACGQNIPSWYTRVSAYHDWIMCIMREVRRWNNRAKVERICTARIRKFEADNIIDEL